MHNYLASRLLEQQGLIEAAARQDYRVVVLPSTSDRPDSRDPGLIFYIWCDRNGDGIAQPEEVQFIEVPSPQDGKPLRDVGVGVQVNVDPHRMAPVPGDIRLLVTRSSGTLRAILYRGVASEAKFGSFIRRGILFAAHLPRRLRSPIGRNTGPEKRSTRPYRRRI